MAEVVVKKWAKPEGFSGRGKGKRSFKTNKWEIAFYDGEKIKTGKYPTIDQMNEGCGLNLTNDIVWRLTTGKRVDTKKRNGANSFLTRWGHIKITKIVEPIL